MSSGGNGNAYVLRGQAQAVSNQQEKFDPREFNQVLSEHRITPSMSRKGNCWDNACSEMPFGSLKEMPFGSLKVERLHGMRFQTIRQAKYENLDWLLWYNRTRMQYSANTITKDF
jgi:transposase InsO family protein